MQALILAAGMGKRLGKYTNDATKCMVPVNGKTLIEYSIEAIINVKEESDIDSFLQNMLFAVEFHHNKNLFVA